MKSFKFYVILTFLLCLFSSAFAQTPPTLLKPVNNDNCIAKDIKMEWTAVPIATSYILEVSDMADFSNLIVNMSGLTVTNATVTLPAWNTAYWWRVTSVFPSNSYGVSAPWTFKTKIVPPDLVSPVNGLSCADSLIEFKWRKADAEFYTLQISENPLFTTNILDKNNISDTSYKFRLPKYNQLYYWRVASKKSLCLTEFSSTWNITTKEAPSVLLFPANNTLGGDLFTAPPFNIKLLWDSAVANDTYDLQVSKKQDFSVIFAESINSADTNFLLNIPGDFDSTFYWRVRIHRNSCTSYWSDAFKFKTPYDSVDLIEPLLNETCISKYNTYFKWAAMSGVQKYRIQISDTVSFSRLTYDSSNISAREIYLNLPASSKVYYWRVRGNDNNNTGLWSAVRSFTTTLRAPAVISPANEQIGVNRSINFSWENMGAGARYDFQLFANKNLTVKLVDTVSHDSSGYFFTVPNDNAEYYWRVRYKNLSCTGEWSEIKTFKTLVASPVLLKPVNNATKVTVYPIFEWSPAIDALTYEIEISENQAFNPKFFSDRGITTTTWTEPGLMYSEKTKYYWRVRSKNNDGVSAWSVPFSFTTSEYSAAIPLVLYPENNAVKIPMSPVLRWHKSFNAVSYKVTVATDNEFNNIFLTQETNDTTLEAVGLERFTNYWWKVQSIGNEGPGGVSAVYTFRTMDIAPVEIVTLLNPPNNAVNMDLFLTLTWQAAERAVLYHVQVATGNDFSESTLFENLESVLPTKKTIVGLEYNKTYYWRVAARNEAGTAEWSQVYKFTTKADITSVKDNDFNVNSHNISPNPVLGTANLKINAISPSKGSIRIINLLGEELIRINDVNINSGENIIPIDMTALNSGIYFYSIETSTGNSVGKIIIK